MNLAGAMNIPPTSDKLKPHENATWCVVLARSPGRLQPLLTRGWKLLGKDDGLNKADPWSDDYINILAPLIENLKTNINQYRTSMAHMRLL